jgi:3-hydroxyisobutyrate dehydrogenase-like beta-hydroxyacid dehydrogenase
MKVAFLGLGIMGSRMAANLVRAGHDVTGWTRTEGKAATWARHHGASAADTPAQALRGAEAAISMVVDGAQVREVLGEAVEGAAADTLFADMSTIAPSDARAVAELLHGRAMRFLDAPVTGSSPRAEDGTLTIMAGGDPADFERARPLFEEMGSTVLHVGPLGHGQAIKLINNAVAAVNAATLAQALVVGEGLEVDLGKLVEVMAAGSGNSTMLGLKAGPMRERDYTPLFKLEHMLKDLRLCLEEGQAAGVPFPAAGLARELYTAALGRGLGEQDFAAVMEPVRDLAGRPAD